MDAQLQSGGPRRSTCLDLPKDLVLERLSRFNLLGDLPVQGSQEVIMTRPAQGPNSREAVMPHPSQAHASACLGICTLTQGHLALRLQQYWAG